MDKTTNLSLPYIMAAQAQKHVTHNEDIRALNAVVQLSATSKSLSAPPANPIEGQRFIIAASPTGAWQGKTGQIAAWQDGAWMFYPPQEGWLAWVTNDDALFAWDGTNWVQAGGGDGGGSASVNPVSLVGVNTTADTTNKLAVKSDAVLLSHDDVTPGSGDVQVKLNKAGTVASAAFMFQDNWSGRAEIGLTGDDDFHFKVSPNGTTWHDNLIIDKDNGRVRIKGSNPIAKMTFVYITAGTTFNGGDIFDFDNAAVNVGHSTGYGPITSGTDQGKYRCEYSGNYLVNSSVQPGTGSANHRAELMLNNTMVYRAKGGFSAGYSATEASSILVPAVAGDFIYRQLNTADTAFIFPPNCFLTVYYLGEG
jgi:hypothetical protein